MVFAQSRQLFAITLYALLLSGCGKATPPAEDPSSDVILKAALSLARALCTKSAGTHDHIEVDFDLLDKAMLDIEKQLLGFDEVSKSANTVVSAGGKILNRARIMQESLSKHVEVLNDVIADARTLVEAGMVKH